MDDRVVIGLFRHGLTEANSRRQFCGWTDVPVSEEGIHKLQQLAAPAYEWVVTSDLLRCAQTASVFWPAQPAAAFRELREFHFGDWEGKTHSDLEHTPEYLAWLGDYSRQVPGGDSYESFARRVEQGFQSVLDEMAARSIRRTAIVAHGGVVRHLLSVRAPEAKPFEQWASQNGQGYELSGSLSQIREGRRCTSLQAVPSTARKNGC